MQVYEGFFLDEGTYPLAKSTTEKAGQDRGGSAGEGERRRVPAAKIPRGNAILHGRMQRAWPVRGGRLGAWRFRPATTFSSGKLAEPVDLSKDGYTFVSFMVSDSGSPPRGHAGGSNHGSPRLGRVLSGQDQLRLVGLAEALGALRRRHHFPRHPHRPFGRRRSLRGRITSSLPRLAGHRAVPLLSRRRLPSSRGAGAVGCGRRTWSIFPPNSISRKSPPAAAIQRLDRRNPHRPDLALGDPA